VIFTNIKLSNPLFKDLVSFSPEQNHLKTLKIPKTRGKGSRRLADREVPPSGPISGTQKHHKNSMSRLTALNARQVVSGKFPENTKIDRISQTCIQFHIFHFTLSKYKIKQRLQLP